MANFKFELNKSGVRELLLSDEMQKACSNYTNKALSNLGEGYEVTDHKGKNRVNSEIAAVSYQARKENSENNTILKSLRGGDE